MIDGNLTKMRTEYGEPVQYILLIGTHEIPANPLIGKNIRFYFSGKINCIACGNTTSKSFSSGFCYQCMMNSPMNSPCIIRPELCMAHEGEGRDMEWEKQHHLQPHIAYLAVASGLKIGVTRATQIPTRWIDQGAWKAIRLSEVPNRHLAGQIEVRLKNFISDKTNWQKMLRNIKAASIDLAKKKAEFNALLPEALASYLSPNNEIMTFHYPVNKYPLSVKSTGFDKEREISGKLSGIKGQYFIFDDGRVLNIRKHSGYHVRFESD